MAGNSASRPVRIGVDIGGTFTDVVLQVGEHRHTAKVLTTPSEPERGFMQAIDTVMGLAGIAPGEVELIVHGTTLATNALIERKGARTAFITTQGFRDTLEMATESRYEQYDLNIDLPEPLVPRAWRLTVDERIDAAGQVLRAPDPQAVLALAPRLRALAIESVAVGFLNSYRNPAHEQQVAQLLAQALPDIPITQSAQVSPEMREYPRFSTACANAYVRPLMDRYLERLQALLARRGLTCPMFLMLSGGGITTVETARAFPVRLVESGPAGGAIFAAHIAAELGLEQVLSYDMGGTTAKICFIDDQVPQTSSTFEVARIYRFRKGSGLPLRIPVIEMVEIGAGGGSIARLDTLGNIQVGPESAGSEPGPACYGRGGGHPTVTDADLLLGRIDPGAFAAGRIPLDRAAAEAAMSRAIGAGSGLSNELAAFGVSEMVDENMASAARVHGIESGKDVAVRTLIAFGGAAPLHALRVAEKLGISRVVIPGSAGVGSAVGFLLAPVAFEISASHPVPLARFEPESFNATVESVRREALAVVSQTGPHEALVERRTAFIRYVGQGYPIAVSLPNRPLGSEDEHFLMQAFETEYRRLYGRLIPGLQAEMLGLSLSIATPAAPVQRVAPVPHRPAPPAQGQRRIFEASQRRFVTAGVWHRPGLEPGMTLDGPAVIVEDETATVVTAGFRAEIDAQGYIICTRKDPQEKSA